MAKAIEDLGHAVVANKPWRPRVYPPNALPDAIECAGCIIVVNDSGSGAPPRLAMAVNGSWRTLAFADEVRGSVAPSVDVTPLVRQTVQELLPAPVAQALPAPVDDDGFRHDMARTVVAMSEAINELQRRVQYLETHALKDTDQVHAEFLRQAG